MQRIGRIGLMGFGIALAGCPPWRQFSQGIDERKHGWRTGRS